MHKSVDGFPVGLGLRFHPRRQAVAFSQVDAGEFLHLGLGHERGLPARRCHAFGYFIGMLEELVQLALLLEDVTIAISSILMMSFFSVRTRCFFRITVMVGAGLADRWQHFMSDPALERFGLGLAGFEDQSIEPGLVDDGDFLEPARGTQIVRTLFVVIQQARCVAGHAKAQHIAYLPANHHGFPLSSCSIVSKLPL